MKRRSVRAACRKVLRSSPRLNGALGWRTWRTLWGNPDAAAIVRRLGDRARRPLSFMQIGANDGLHADPLHAVVRARHWSGLLVEPLPHLFTRLRANYEGAPGLRFARVAVGSEDGEAVMFSLTPREGDPSWAGALGTFRREVIMSHAGDIADLATRIEEVRVPVATLTTLMETYHLAKVDLLHTDTEGYDYEIIRQIDVDAPWAPECLLYEVKHLGPKTVSELHSLLTSAGYVIVDAGIDEFAYRPGGRLP